MKKYIEIIKASAYFDYTNNVSSDDGIKNFSAIVFEKYGILLDEAYLNFLIKLNGFEYYGLRFYGTKEQPDFDIQGALEENKFWKSEFQPDFDEYFIVAEDEMDFYCYDPLTKRYISFDKTILSKDMIFHSFQEFISELIKMKNP